MYKILNSNITIYIKDMSRAINFYVDELGFNLIQQYGNHYAQISVPGILIGLHPSGKNLISSENISIGFTVESFCDAKNRLAEMGIQFEERQEEGETSFILKTRTIPHCTLLIPESNGVSQLSQS